LVVPQCFAAPHNSERIVGARRWALSLYKAVALIATEVLTASRLVCGAGGTGRTPMTTLPLIINWGMLPFCKAIL